MRSMGGGRRTREDPSVPHPSLREEWGTRDSQSIREEALVRDYSLTFFDRIAAAGLQFPHHFSRPARPGHSGFVDSRLVPYAQRHRQLHLRLATPRRHHLPPDD